jgi:hypothetical protein
VQGVLCTSHRYTVDISHYDVSDRISDVSLRFVKAVSRYFLTQFGLLALDSLGQTEKALNELKIVQSISDQVGHVMLQANSRKALGMIL